MEQINLKNIIDRNVLIIGMGKSGLAAMQTLVNLGVTVSIQDARNSDEFDPQLLAFIKEKDIKCYFNETPSNMEEFDTLVLSPGVSQELPLVQEAMKNGAEIIGELEIAFRIGSGTYVAITGTNGKTTTTTIVGEIFKNAKLNTSVVGNIGVAVITESVTAQEDQWMITETSSFQLETTKYFKPHIAAFLNLTPDHLDRHHTMKKYGEAKAAIYRNQQKNDFLIANYDDKIVHKLAKKAKSIVVPFSIKKKLKFGAYIDDNKIVIKNLKKEKVVIIDVEDIKILGSHNVQNCLAAAAIAYFAGIDVQVIKESIESFPGVPHRIEYCGEVDGIKFYNDSKGTNVEATLTALNAVKEKIILIAGGEGKNQDFNELIKGFKGRVKTLILIGKDAETIAEAASNNNYNHVTIQKDMEDSIRYAYEIAEVGDNVLLSPGCASWDMYSNFEQRGDHFRNCVYKLGE